MKRLRYIVVVVVLAVLVASVVWVVLSNQTQTPANSNLPIQYSYHIDKTYPHDTSAFTEGLVFSNGFLYESTGTFDISSSSLRQVNLETGIVQKQISLQSQYFGEGLTVVNDKLIQLTWQNRVAFIYDKKTFGSLGNFSYATEGWGLTYNGSELIMSDGSSNLYFFDPVTFEKIGQVSVHAGNTSVTNINELEFVKGDVYANIWLEQRIAIINPQTGVVKGWIDLAGIYQSNNVDEVLNGIAYDFSTERLFVTGKDWPNLYQITISPKT